MFEIMKTIVIEEIEEIELKSKNLEVIERMKENLEEFETKMLKNEIKASEKKKIEKSNRNRRSKKRSTWEKKMAILGIRTRSGLEELEIEIINKIKELTLSPYWLLMSLWK